MADEVTRIDVHAEVATADGDAVPSAATVTAHPWHARIARWFAANSIIAAIGSLLFLFVFVYFADRMIVTVPVGYEGVIWRRLWGTDLDTVFPEGTQIVFPWNEMTVYDLHVQRYDLDVIVLSTDGLQIKVALSVRYHPEAKTLPHLHQKIGPDYLDRIVVPEVTTAVRQIMGEYRPQELYTVSTDQMESRIIELAAKQARERYVDIDDVLIVQIILPDVVQSAIQAKLRQEQEAQEYDYRIQKEQKEAQRKAIEAQGIADAQKIQGQGIAALQGAAGGISQALLRWRGIEATLELARSNNAKVVIIGSQNGLPVILDANTLSAAAGTAASGNNAASAKEGSPAVATIAPTVPVPPPTGKQPPVPAAPPSKSPATPQTTKK
jgi:regulator of protease activity HflC (stomatin/prohibitin superfamily)